METIESALEKGTELLQQLYGLPAGMLVLISCLVVGYVAKCIRRFPNEAIPVTVILWGAVLTPMLQDARNSIPFRVWIIRGILIGLTIGFLAWLLHNKVLAKIEDRLGLFASKVPTDQIVPDSVPAPQPQPKG